MWHTQHTAHRQLQQWLLQLQLSVYESELKTTTTTGVKHSENVEYILMSKLDAKII